MNRTILTFVFLVLAFHIFSQTSANKAEFNFGFEKITPNQKLPDKYFRWGNVGDYSLASGPLEFDNMANKNIQGTSFYLYYNV